MPCRIDVRAMSEQQQRTAVCCCYCFSYLVDAGGTCATPLCHHVVPAVHATDHTVHTCLPHLLCLLQDMWRALGLALHSHQTRPGATLFLGHQAPWAAVCDGTNRQQRWQRAGRPGGCGRPAAELDGSAAARGTQGAVGAAIAATRGCNRRGGSWGCKGSVMLWPCTVSGVVTGGGV
jgi:hypothetical protein